MIHGNARAVPLQRVLRGEIYKGGIQGGQRDVSLQDGSLQKVAEWPRRQKANTHAKNSLSHSTLSKGTGVPKKSVETAKPSAQARQNGSPRKLPDQHKKSGNGY